MALLAPTGRNQQGFMIELLSNNKVIKDSVSKYIDDVKTDLSLLVDDDSVSFEKNKENAEALLKTAILEWNDILEKHEIFCATIIRLTPQGDQYNEKETARMAKRDMNINTPNRDNKNTRAAIYIICALIMLVTFLLDIYFLIGIFGGV